MTIVVMWTWGTGRSGIGLKKWARLSTGFIDGSRVTWRLRERVSNWLVGTRWLSKWVICEVVRPWSGRCMSIRISGYLGHWSWLSK